jgi:Haem-dependent oxidative N-demethylase, alpha subunit-like
MRFQRGPVGDFFNPWHEPADVLKQRRHWLRHEPDVHSALLPDGAPLLEEMIEQSRHWFGPPLPCRQADPRETLRVIGEALEPDFLLLKPDDTGAMKLVAGCVCFPSSWSLEEKMGRPLDFIHRVVPGLNEQLGQPIAQFLRRMTPDIAWLRANWGLSRSPELNQHPKRALPRLDASVKLDDVWLRVEHQALVALPKTGGVLFGIRVVVHPLAEVKQDAEAARGLRRALETMPEAMAAYKGIAPARGALLEIMNLSAS